MRLSLQLLGMLFLEQPSRGDAKWIVVCNPYDTAYDNVVIENTKFLLPSKSCHTTEIPSKRNTLEFTYASSSPHTWPKFSLKASVNPSIAFSADPPLPGIRYNEDPYFTETKEIEIPTNLQDYPITKMLISFVLDQCYLAGQTDSPLTLNPTVHSLGELVIECKTKDSKRNKQALVNQFKWRPQSLSFPMFHAVFHINNQILVLSNSLSRISLSLQTTLDFTHPSLPKSDHPTTPMEKHEALKIHLNSATPSPLYSTRNTLNSDERASTLTANSETLLPDSTSDFVTKINSKGETFTSFIHDNEDRKVSGEILDRKIIPGVSHLPLQESPLLNQIPRIEVSYVEENKNKEEIKEDNNSPVTLNNRKHSEENRSLYKAKETEESGLKEVRESLNKHQPYNRNKWENKENANEQQKKGEEYFSAHNNYLKKEARHSLDQALGSSNIENLNSSFFKISDEEKKLHQAAVDDLLNGPVELSSEESRVTEAEPCKQLPVVDYDTIMLYYRHKYGNGAYSAQVPMRAVFPIYTPIESIISFGLEQKSRNDPAMQNPLSNSKTVTDNYANYNTKAALHSNSISGVDSGGIGPIYVSNTVMGGGIQKKNDEHTVVKPLSADHGAKSWGSGLTDTRINRNHIATENRAAWRENPPQGNMTPNKSLNQQNKNDWHEYSQENKNIEFTNNKYPPSTFFENSSKKNNKENDFIHNNIGQHYRDYANTTPMQETINSAKTPNSSAVSFGKFMRGEHVGRQQELLKFQVPQQPKGNPVQYSSPKQATQNEGFLSSVKDALSSVFGINNS